MAEGNLFDLAAIFSQMGTISGAPNALAGAGGVFQDLSRRQQATEQKANVQDQLAALIGTPSTQFQSQQPLRPGEQPQVFGDAATGLTATQGFNEQQVSNMQNLGAVSPESLLRGLSGQIFSKPQQLKGDVEQFMSAQKLSLIPKDMSFQDFLSKVKKPSTVVNVGGNKPVGSKAVNFVNSKGENPSVLATLSDIEAGGFKPTTAEQRKSSQAGEAAAPLMGEMINLGFGKGKQKSLFPSSSENVLSRLAGGVSAKISGITDSNQRIALYNQSKDALVTGLARLVGQVGTLTETDVETVAGLFPTLGQTPEPQAKAQFKQIATLLKGKGVPEAKLKKMGFPSWSLSGSGISKPLTQAGFDKLPSGASFINPSDGRTLIKR